MAKAVVFFAEGTEECVLLRHPTAAATANRLFPV